MTQAQRAEDVLTGVVTRLEKTDSSTTPDTPTRRGNFTEEEIRKSIEFFSRMRLIYGGRFGVQFPDEESLRLARREWAKQIGGFTDEELAKGLERTKRRLSEGDPEVYWPDIGAVLSLARDRRRNAHHVFPSRLPEPDWMKDRRRNTARQGMGKIKDLMRGSSC